MFTDQELALYSRHFTLPMVGKKGQLALKNSRVLCIGAGGLGAPILLYLAAAGVGTLGVVDNDLLDLSNLQRQILYTQADVGKPKAECARDRLKALNPNVDVIPYVVRLTKKNALKIIQNYDIVVDGSDNFATRYLVNDACFTLGKPNVYGSIFQFEGQCSIFWKDHGPCYRCLFPSVPEDFAPNCAEAGVLGVLPGLLGCIQANEVIKLILKIGDPLIGRLFSLDALSMEAQKFPIAINAHCELCQGQKSFLEMEYNDFEFCALEQETQPRISLEDFKKLQLEKEKFHLIDVRERSDHQLFNIGGQCMPIESLNENMNSLSKEEKIILYCDVGEISKKAANLFKFNGFKEVYSLDGGIIGLQ